MIAQWLLGRSVGSFYDILVLSEVFKSYPRTFQSLPGPSQGGTRPLDLPVSQ